MVRSPLTGEKNKCIPQAGPSLSSNTMNRNARPPNSSASAGTRYSVGPPAIDPALRAPASSPIRGPSGPTTLVHPAPGAMSKAAGIVLEINQLKQRVAQLEGEKDDMMGQLNRIKTDARNEKTRLDDIIVDMKREMAEMYEELNGHFDGMVAKKNHDDKTSDNEDGESSKYDSDGLPIHDQETRRKVAKSKEACKQNLIKVCSNHHCNRSFEAYPDLCSLLSVMSSLKPWAVQQLGS